jgi:catechol 2,3-dioxygenase
MIRARKLGHIVLKVRDAAKSRDFYVRTLGLKIASERLDQGMVFLSCGEQHHDLALFQLASGETPAEAQPGMHHMAWNVGTFDDLRDAYHELKAAGVEMRLTEHNVTRSIYVYDPDGNRVELYCDVAENANESGFEAMQRIGPKAVPMTFD